MSMTTKNPTKIPVHITIDPRIVAAVKAKGWALSSYLHAAADEKLSREGIKWAKKGEGK